MANLVQRTDAKELLYNASSGELVEHARSPDAQLPASGAIREFRSTWLGGPPLHQIDCKRCAELNGMRAGRFGS